MTEGEKASSLHWGALFYLHHFQPGTYLPVVSTSRSKDTASRSHRQEAGPAAHLKTPVGGGPPSQRLTQADVLSSARLAARTQRPGASAWAESHGPQVPGKPLSAAVGKASATKDTQFLRLDTPAPGTCACPFLYVIPPAGLHGHCLRAAHQTETALGAASGREDGFPKLIDEKLSRWFSPACAESHGC